MNEFIEKSKKILQFGATTASNPNFYYIVYDMIYIYIYVYGERERERERDLYFFWYFQLYISSLLRKLKGVIL